MKYFECAIKKIELLKFVKSKLSDYMLTEEDDEYQERYDFYTSASYSIKPNKFKGNPSSASLHIDREDSSTLLLGGTREEQLVLFDKFNKAPINKQIVLNTFKTVYEIAHYYKYYDHHNIQKISEKLEKWLDNPNRLQDKIEVGLKYGLVGKMTTGRSKSINGQLYLSEHYYMADDLTILPCHTLEFPMKGLFKMTVSILHNKDKTMIYLTKTENGANEDVTNPEVLKQSLNDRFLDRYHAAVKKWLNVEKVDYNEDYILLLEMVKI
jgi:hypothetical protein